mmetsp:Transcript_12850/g.16274  ORF Transcript_12850/g.16274 Transcript_12850/m.16274 type:complete len:87 (+) Transcript_12850:1053-1313(+)
MPEFCSEASISWRRRTNLLRRDGPDLFVDLGQASLCSIGGMVVVTFSGGGGVTTGKTFMPPCSVLCTDKLVNLLSTMESLIVETVR